MDSHVSIYRVTILIVALVIAGACAVEPNGAQVDSALETITAAELVEHVQVLSSDEFRGRLPGTVGEEKTLAYLLGQAESIGLQPGNGESWYQEVPLVSIAADPDMTLNIRDRNTVRGYAYGDDFMAWTTRVVDRTDLEDSELVFVGFGIVAPEYDWNDYEGIDVTGKTVVILVNDPGYYAEDPEFFNGRAMTYYGRWTYKYEEAARQGAAGAMIIHQTAPAAYGWSTVEGSWTGPQFHMVADDNNMSRVKVEGWFQYEMANEIFEMAGADLEALTQAALGRDFEAVPLGVTASLTVRNTIERSTSNNFLALLPGNARPEQYVIYMGHWDHLGTDPSLEGDSIYNGALDNATGTAGLLELAEAFASLDSNPERSILFWWTTAEEQGLLGSAYYAANPIYRLDQTVAAINIDGLNIYGPMRDIFIVGYGNSELDDYLIRHAADQGREVKPDPEPEKGYFYRSDHFPLAKQGVPALYTDAGNEHVEHGEAWTREKKDEWTANKYHQVTDEYSEDWDLTGAVDDLRLFFRIGYELANEESFPEWREGTEFKAKREAMMGTSQ